MQAPRHAGNGGGGDHPRRKSVAGLCLPIGWGPNGIEAEQTLVPSGVPLEPAVFEDLVPRCDRRARERTPEPGFAGNLPTDRSATEPWRRDLRQW